jgi:hypothetical protein
MCEPVVRIVVLADQHSRARAPVAIGMAYGVEIMDLNTGIREVDLNWMSRVDTLRTGQDDEVYIKARHSTRRLDSSSVPGYQPAPAPCCGVLTSEVSDKTVARDRARFARAFQRHLARVPTSVDVVVPATRRRGASVTDRPRHRELGTSSAPQRSQPTAFPQFSTAFRPGECRSRCRRAWRSLSLRRQRSRVRVRARSSVAQARGVTGRASAPRLRGRGTRTRPAPRRTPRPRAARGPGCGSAGPRRR